MSWITVIWSATSGACVMLALMHLLVWFRDRRSWASLCFSFTVVGVLGLAISEVITMHTDSPEVFGHVFRWTHLVYAVGVIGSLGFVHFYFGTGRKWLLALAIGLRVLVQIPNFTTGVNLHIASIQSLQKINFLGEQVSILGEWVTNPWVRLGWIAALVQLAYLVDASIRLWRSGLPESRKRAAIVGGSLVFFFVFAVANAALVSSGVLRMPFILSFPFLGILLAMGYELSRDVLRAAQLGRELRESEQRMTQAADAANLGIWIRDLVRDKIWATDHWRELLGFAKSEQIDLNAFFQKLHPEDREAISRTLAAAVAGHGRYDTEYRVVLPEGRVRWIASRGRVEFNGSGKPVLVRGVSVDITGRKQAEVELAQQRNELSHLSRVTTMSELSSSLAHELNQPLAIILTNSQAAQRLLAQEPPDVAETRDILADIVSEDERAGEVIRRLRALLKPGQTQRLPLSVNEIIEDVLRIARSDLIGRGVTVHTVLAESAPQVSGDRIQLQQVLLNLILNASDAMAGNPAAQRRLAVTTAHRDGLVRISVSDNGSGLPAEPERIFQPFYTTKKDGLGLGLAICRSIVTAHQGRLWAEANAAADRSPAPTHAGQGTTLQLELPAVKGASGEGHVKKYEQRKSSSALPSND